MNTMTTYIEARESITEERCSELKAILEAAEPKNTFEVYHLRRLAFRSADEKHGVPQFCLCVKNQDEKQIYLEKKYQQNGVYFRRTAPLSREECDRIVSGDIEWMKNHKTSLFTDFYRQVSLNLLSPDRITDYERESMTCRKEGCVTFTKRIDRATGTPKSLFEEPEFTFSCLDEGKMMVSYKKEAMLPSVLISILQLQESEPALVY